jgi:hypothetical protein
MLANAGSSGDGCRLGHVSSPAEIEQLQAAVDFYRDRVALLRAKRYRWGLASNTRLQALERALERAQTHLREARLRAMP